MAAIDEHKQRQAVTLTTWHFATSARNRRSVRDERTLRVAIDADAWLDPAARLLAFDRDVHAAEDRALAAGWGRSTEAASGAPALELAIEGEEPGLSLARAQIALRYQRLFARRNATSDHAAFDALLVAHARLHDRTKPLVRADHEHALDVWQWVLRLVPDASAALQIAALFHDVERLASEAERRVEQHADDYLAFKQRHAARGAAMMLDALADLPIAPEVKARAAALVERHEQSAPELELAALNDADALSFFGLNSAGFLAYFGPEHTQKKVAYTLARMRSAAARTALQKLRLEPAIQAAIAAVQPT